MTAREKLDASLALRMPVFTSDDRLEQRIERLDDYMLLTAFHEGELSQARLENRDALYQLEREWEAVSGFEQFQGGRKTDVSVDDAKRHLRPKVWEGIKKARWLDRQLTEEIDRLDRDAKKCSRSYTLITRS